PLHQHSERDHLSAADGYLALRAGRRMDGQRSNRRHERPMIIEAKADPVVAHAIRPITDAPQSAPHHAKRVTRMRNLAIWCAVFALLKLWMIHGDEIVARDYSGGDDPWYVMSASHWYWDAPFGEWTFFRQPGYPLWIAFARLSGVPF